jgi:hypothetical protein
MVFEKVVPISIAIPKPYRDLLRKMAAEASLKNPDQIVTTSQLGREILCAFLRERLEELSKKKA